jgi:hypothetical protein
MIPTIQPTKLLSRFDPNRADPHQFGKQAYDLTHDRNFWQFAKANNVPEAAGYLAKKCGVEALRFIDDTPEAIAKWQELKAKYQDWLNKQNV